MDATLSLLNLAGAVVLLLWGVHTVQSGVQRAFGSDLRRFLAGAARALTQQKAEFRRREADALRTHFAELRG